MGFILKANAVGRMLQGYFLSLFLSAHMQSWYCIRKTRNLLLSKVYKLLFLKSTISYPLEMEMTGFYLLDCLSLCFFKVTYISVQGTDLQNGL